MERSGVVPRVRSRVGIGWPMAAALAALAGCAPLQEEKPAAEAPPALPEPAPPPPVVAPPPAVTLPAPRAGRRATPIPTRPLQVRADCNFRDPNGYAGKMKLDVAAATVLDFWAEVHVPNRGMCRFALPQFRQTATLPNVELAAHGSRCMVRMWEQGPRVTVAFTDCAALCTGDAIDYLWPILADARTGGCG